jgi:Cytochrome c
MLIRFSNTVGRRLAAASTLAAACLLFNFGGSFSIYGQEGKQAEETAKSPSNADLIARGKYIVGDVAVCAQCHTPRDQNGEPDRTRWLQGAPVFLQPAESFRNWAIVAPRLAGLPPGRDAEIITLLTTGVWSNGKPPRQPMPRFHMTRMDAEAVLAYLKSP